jgi:hypothetical protein
MPIHCLRCGGQLNPEPKEPLCSYCKSEIAREVIIKSPAWALRIALEALSEELNNLKREVQTFSGETRKLLESLKQKA